MKNKNFIIVLLVLLSVGLNAQDAKGALKVDAQGDVIVKNNLVGGNGNTYDPLPVGTILMFSGKDWEDNVSIPGWYACVASNSIHGVPDLTNRFIMGVDKEGYAIKTEAEKQGGANEITLTEAQMPKHDHNIDHDHNETTTGNNLQNHSHGMTHMHSYPVRYNEDGSGSAASQQDVEYGNRGGYGTKYTDYFTGNTGGISSHHQHKYDLPSLSYNRTEKISDTSNQDYTSGTAGSNAAFDNRPAYYSVIYIIKVQ